MEEQDYNQIFDEALEQKAIAGFQNMGDMEGACKFAEKEKYDISKKQQVRSLILQKEGITWLMFVLALKNKKDIVVFHKGIVKDVGYGNAILKTTPIKIIEVN